ncbi:bifunctional lysylphosphatidylglycerol flippase/synthetase MprF [Aporhodopirellula aestuarii]|uniref:DUF2156 domain-containing protein n=1 Tax=Aporhodopirellula aestuarii TaxID=2950107 RepID=A0ABT0U3Q9_9BACT|nr:DUF2156 domain-containing protein [Aporhodopirellula aestuarii]MCM2371549.1 DUF2156 domain-containing protein [Aporhodopirellula aestuarii]
MDARNLIHSKTTYRIIRGEHLLVLAVSGGLILWNAGNINWLRAIFAFAIIDVVGYLPGAMAFRKSVDKKIDHWYYHAYNFAHTYLVTGVAVAIWAYFGGFEWAMLAVPFHLSIDRGVFGNILKPKELAFEVCEHTDEEILSALGRKPSNIRTTNDIDELVSPEVLDEVLAHPSGNLSLSKRNSKFAVDGVAGFISYREQGKHLWMFGGVHAAAEDAAKLLDQFASFAAASGKRVAAVQVRASQVELFTSRGFTVNQMGSTYAVKLEAYSFSGKKKMQLRNKINRAKKDGLRVVELGKDVPADQDWRAQLDAISQSWLSEKRKPELDFMVGDLEGDLLDQRRIFLVMDAEERPVAFISYVPVRGKEQPGYLHDLTRKIADAPVGAMELCNATAIERFQAEGVSYLHFGFTPFVVDDEAEGLACGWLHRAIHWLRKNGARWYPTDSQVAYKTKWGTDWIEREYIAVRSVSFRAAFDLMRLTNTI